MKLACRNNWALGIFHILQGGDILINSPGGLHPGQWFMHDTLDSTALVTHDRFSLRAATGYDNGSRLRGPLGIGHDVERRQGGSGASETPGDFTKGEILSHLQYLFSAINGRGLKSASVVTLCDPLRFAGLSSKLRNRSDQSRIHFYRSLCCSLAAQQC